MNESATPNPQTSEPNATQAAQAESSQTQSSQPTSAPAAAAAPAAQPASELIDIEHFMKVKLRVGQIEQAEPVEKSKKLIKLQVNLGEELGKRQILAGVAQFYSPEALVGRRIIVVSNLKPAKLMGLESQGMLLAGASADGSQLAIVEPAAELPLGAVVR